MQGLACFYLSYPLAAMELLPFLLQVKFFAAFFSVKPYISCADIFAIISGSKTDRVKGSLYSILSYIPSWHLHVCKQYFVILSYLNRDM